jgi:hypothetical protein
MIWLYLEEETHAQPTTSVSDGLLLGGEMSQKRPTAETKRDARTRSMVGTKRGDRTAM